MKSKSNKKKAIQYEGSVTNINEENSLTRNYNMKVQVITNRINFYYL